MRYHNTDQLSKLRDFRRGISIDGQKLQMICLVISNNSGTLRHSFTRDASAIGLFSPWVDKIIGVNNDFSYSNTPTVNSTTQFVNGGGFAAGSSTTDHFVLNTADQTVQNLIELAEVEFYSGNNTRPRVWPRFVSRNVAGIVRNRLELTMSNDLTGAAWNFNTTTLPAGQVIIIRILAALQ